MEFIGELLKANWQVLLVVLIMLLVWNGVQLVKNQKLSKEIKALKQEILDRHKNLGSSVSGKYKNLGEQISDEHRSIKKDTESVHNMMLLEKQNREKLYNNTSRAKEILETIDVMKEVVNKNAQLSQEVAVLTLKNETYAKNDSNRMLNALRRFEGMLSQFEDFKETEGIRATLKIIENQLSKYID
ncbi:hypothetical protein [Lactococcus allomyrinae]|uniref:Uncharacterized protein n=1 Tax=Lactococcus allomyrinae TaxID=2419773 RepID=A0A387BGN1_9LACT|nr:hypothetical protein [Lactococcus allomyrinae]AYG01312.1 hypothetical protein D7I46_09520 [Lactococcus allomyrinae]